MEEYLRDDAIRKAIAVYYIKEILDRDYKGRKIVFARDIAEVSLPYVSRWIQPADIKAIPTIEHIKRIEENTNYSIESMLKQTISMGDPFGILKNSEAAKKFRKVYSFGEERTHDDSPAHKSNLRTFAGHEYELFYLDAKDNKLHSFQIDRIREPEKEGILEIRMSRGKLEKEYIGTIVAPPELDRAFIFVSQKNGDGNYLDRGMIVLYFPQERARHNNNGYQCGVGAAMTLDRHAGHNVLFQRVVLLQKEIKTSPGIKRFIRSYLAQSVEGQSVLTIKDLPENQRKLYSYIAPNDQ